MCDVLNRRGCTCMLIQSLHAKNHSQNFANFVCFGDWFFGTLCNQCDRRHGYTTLGWPAGLVAGLLGPWLAPMLCNLNSWAGFIYVPGVQD